MSVGSRKDGVCLGQPMSAGCPSRFFYDRSSAGNSLADSGLVGHTDTAARQDRGVGSGFLDRDVRGGFGSGSRRALVGSFYNRNAWRDDGGGLPDVCGRDRCIGGCQLLPVCAATARGISSVASPAASAETEFRRGSLTEVGLTHRSDVIARWTRPDEVATLPADRLTNPPGRCDLRPTCVVQRSFRP